MRIISDNEQLDYFLSNQSAKDNSSIKELNIILIEEYFSSKQVQQLGFLHRISPNIVNLKLQIEKTLLDNNFLLSLQSAIENIIYLQSISLHIQDGKFSMKMIKSFVQFIHSKFFPEEIIQYRYEDDMLYFMFGGCKIGFEYIEDSSLFIKLLQSNKLEIFISKGQTKFLNIVERAIQSEIDNLQVLLHHEKLFVSCSNCSLSYQLELIINFEDRSDLLEYSIEHHSFIETNIDYYQYFDTTDQCSLIKQQPMNNRSILVFQINKDEYVFLSFKNSIFSEEQKECVKQSLIKYEIQRVFLNTPFEISFFKQFIQPQVIQQHKDVLCYFTFCLKFQFGIVVPILKIRQGIKRKKEKKHNLKIEFGDQFSLLDMIEHYFNQFKDNQSEVMKLTIYNSIKCWQNETTINNYSLYQEFLDRLSLIDMNQHVNKLSIRLDCETKQISYQIISALKQLKFLSVKFNYDQRMIDFLITNKKSLSYQGLSYITLSFKNTGRFYSREEINNSQLKRIICSFDRILVLQFQNYELYQFVSMRSFKQFKKLAKVEVFEKNYPYDDDDDYYTDNDYNDQIWFGHYQNGNRPGELLNEKGKLYYAYQLVENHDSQNCSWTNKDYCTCNNNQIQKLLKKPDEFFIEKIKQRYF